MKIPKRLEKIFTIGGKRYKFIDEVTGCRECAFQENNAAFCLNMHYKNKTMIGRKCYCSIYHKIMVEVEDETKTDDITLTSTQQLSKDLIDMKFEQTDTLEDCSNKFFDILRNHNIKQGTTYFNTKGQEVGRTCNNYDYSIAQTMFLDRIKTFFELRLNFESIPEDVE